MTSEIQSKHVPKVSVLVTVYNREKYLSECLESVLASEWQDFEVVVVDDGSTDSSVAIARRYQALDTRIKFFQNEHNLGDYPNRNKAASLASGQWLKYVDSDDRIEPNCLTVMLEAANRWPQAKLIMSYPRPENRVRPILLDPAEAMREHFMKKQGFLCAGPLLCLIEREAFRQVGGFRPKARNMGDTILWLELCKRWPMIIVESELTFWRQHSEQEYQLVRGGGWDNTLTHCQLSTVLLRDFIRDDSPLQKKEVRKIRRQIHFNNFRRLLWHFKNLKLKQFLYESNWALQMLTGNYSRCVPRQEC